MNTIWEIADDDGNCYSTQREITNLIVTHFEHSYKHKEFDGGEAQVLGVTEYPTMFDEEANQEPYKPVMVEELSQVIKTMKGDKSLGPDG